MENVEFDTGLNEAEICDTTLNDIKGIAKVHVDTWHSTYKGKVPDALLGSLSYEESEEGYKKRLLEQKDNQFMYSAKDKSGKVIGYIDGGPERKGDYPDDYGEVYAMYLLSEHQGKGIGSKLLEKAQSFLRNKGFNKMVVWVLKDNDYQRFYEKQGGKLTNEKDEAIKGATLHLAAYEWDLA